MLYKIGKKAFDYSINTLHFVQVTLIFLSCFVIAYWIFQIAGATFIAPVAPFFEGIKDITHIFYNRNSNVNGAQIDFAFLMAAVFMLAVVWLLNLAVEQLKMLEKQYDKAYGKIKDTHQKIFNKQLEKDRNKEEAKNENAIVYLKFKVANAKKDKLFDRNLDEGTKSKENEIIFDFLEFLEEAPDCEHEMFSDGILVKFRNYSNLNKIIHLLDSGLTDLRRKYYSDNWQVDYIMTIDVFEKDTEIVVKRVKLKDLSNTGLSNDFLCFATFKERFALVENKNYYLEEKGVYQIHGENTEVFCIKSLK